MKLEITKAQIQAIISITSDIKSMTGCAGDEQGFPNQDVIWKKQVKLIEKMLINNNIRKP